MAKPEAPLFLVGHSQGGLLVLDYVLHDPSGLAGVVSSGPVLCPPGLSPLLFVLSRLLSRVWPDLPWRSASKRKPFPATRPWCDAYVNDPLVHGKGTPRLGTEVLAAIDWTQAHAADLALPLLIVHGGADRLCAPGASRTFFENVTFPDKQRIEYEGYFHEVFNDVGKERVLADVEAWLEPRLES